ncbi:AMP-dependent synthetase and ligase [Anopheles sinensis]|uniref:AMP-dependent synthetase and ligase n=1 Tax=Anopheles sinensis TaxID=74873 RepID=A0A084W1I5_ANOSI|nr:AMP-dependent synthetase and ligase [Anopheles sinensis]
MIVPGCGAKQSELIRIVDASKVTSRTLAAHCRTHMMAYCLPSATSTTTTTATGFPFGEQCLNHDTTEGSSLAPPQKVALKSFVVLNRANRAPCDDD